MQSIRFGEWKISYNSIDSRGMYTISKEGIQEEYDKKQYVYQWKDVASFKNHKEALRYLWEKVKKEV